METVKVLIRVGDTPFEMAKVLCGDGARWHAGIVVDEVAEWFQ